MTDALLIILTAIVVSANCAILGSFLILRKMAMVGDAIAHSVLPGIVIAFLISGSRDNIPMLIGAAAVGLLTVLMIEFFHKKANLQEDASIGITFTWLFALGVILVSAYTGQVDLDQECVLYGEIAYVTLDVVYFGESFFLPWALLSSGALLVVILLYVLIGFKGLKLTSFNPDYAKALGISTAFWHFSFMGLVSINTVISFDSVGAILIVAMLVIPASTAYLISHKLKNMLWLAVLFGATSSVLGYALAAALDSSIAASIATMGGIQFALVFGLRSLVKGKLKLQSA